MKRKEKIIVMAIALLSMLVIFGGWYSYQQQRELASQYQFPTPREVVETYFTAWNTKNYATMYGTISDGFKRIDPMAKDLASFKQFVESQGITAVKIISLAERSDGSQTAMVAYEVEFTLHNGQQQLFPGTFALKNRQNDIIRGWKLIHPYGENIDQS